MVERLEGLVAPNKRNAEDILKWPYLAGVSLIPASPLTVVVSWIHRTLVVVTMQFPHAFTTPYPFYASPFVHSPYAGVGNAENQPSVSPLAFVHEEDTPNPTPPYRHHSLPTLTSAPSKVASPLPSPCKLSFPFVRAPPPVLILASRKASSLQEPAPSTSHGGLKIPPQLVLLSSLSRVLRTARTPPRGITRSTPYLMAKSTTLPFATRPDSRVSHRPPTACAAR